VKRAVRRRITCRTSDQRFFLPPFFRAAFFAGRRAVFFLGAFLAGFLATFFLAAFFLAGFLVAFFLAGFLATFFRAGFAAFLDAGFFAAGAAGADAAGSIQGEAGGVGGGGVIGDGDGSIQPESLQLISISCISAMLSSSGACRGAGPAAGRAGSPPARTNAGLRCTVRAALQVTPPGRGRHDFDVFAAMR
jgi:hypothetical protein